VRSGTTGSGPAGAGRRAPESELQRSVEYVDRKLTHALTAFAGERQQSA
jgi:hypothetical protein